MNTRKSKTNGRTGEQTDEYECRYVTKSERPANYAGQPTGTGCSENISRFEVLENFLNYECNC